MTVHITDYTPEGKSLSDCSHAELLDTMQSVSNHGMLRMHAHDRMMGQIDGEIRSRGYGWYVYDDEVTPWEKEVGVEWSIAKGGQQLKDEDHHAAIACENREYDIFHAFMIEGPLTDKVKAQIKEKMAELIQAAEERHVKWKEEQAKNPPKHVHCCTGMMIGGLN